MSREHAVARILDHVTRATIHSSLRPASAQSLGRDTSQMRGGREEADSQRLAPVRLCWMHLQIHLRRSHSFLDGRAVLAGVPIASALIAHPASPDSIVVLVDGYSVGESLPLVLLFVQAHRILHSAKRYHLTDQRSLSSH